MSKPASWMGIGEAGLVADVVFRAFSGVRIILIDFWKKGPKYHLQMRWVVLGLWVVVMIPFLLIHLSRVFGGH